MMEENVFRRPAVAAQLREYVEARLHTDGNVNIQRILALQDELTGTKALPFYVLVNPGTGEVLGHFEGATFKPQTFIDFLAQS